jgi:SAM-dependent methyltransferase
MTPDFYKNNAYWEGYVPHTVPLLLPPVVETIEKHGVKSVLDLGCGNGVFLHALVGKCETLVGIEPSETGIAQARKNCPQGKFYQLKLEDDPDLVPERDFDLAISTEVVEHLYFPRLLPRFARRKLRPGGLLLVTTPYHGWLKNVAIAVLNKWDSHHSCLWDGGHIKFWSRASLSELLRQEGFEVIRFSGCGRCLWLWQSMVLVASKVGGLSLL